MCRVILTLDTFDVYKLYLAVQRHFKSKSYNFNKYNGVVNAKRETFLKRRDKGLFNAVRCKYKEYDEIKNYFISNFVDKNDFSIYNSRDSNTHEVFNNWKVRSKDLISYYHRDLRFLSKKPIADQLIGRDGALPDVMKYYIQNKICVETLAILDVYFKFVSRNETLKDDDQFKEIALLISKYKTFLNIEYNKLKNITIKIIRE